MAKHEMDSKALAEASGVSKSIIYAIRRGNLVKPKYFGKVAKVLKCNVEDKVLQLERLIKIPTANIPYEERDSLLINQIITDKETFTEYVTLLLSQDSISTQLELSELKQISSKWNISNTQMPLYETLLKASVLNPSSVLALKKDIDLIQNKEVVSEEFKQLYEEFRLAIEGQ